MTVSDLLELLKGADPDAELRLIYQPSYPMESRVASILSDEDEETGAPVIRFCEGAWVGYASGASWA